MLLLNLWESATKLDQRKKSFNAVGPRCLEKSESRSVIKPLLRKWIFHKVELFLWQNTQSEQNENKSTINVKPINKASKGVQLFKLQYIEASLVAQENLTFDSFLEGSAEVFTFFFVMTTTCEAKIYFFNFLRFYYSSFYIYLIK